MWVTEAIAEPKSYGGASWAGTVKVMPRARKSFEEVGDLGVNFGGVVDGPGDFLAEDLAVAARNRWAATLTAPSLILSVSPISL